MAMRYVGLGVTAQSFYQRMNPTSVRFEHTFKEGEDARRKVDSVKDILVTNQFIYRPGISDPFQKKYTFTLDAPSEGDIDHFNSAPFLAEMGRLGVKGPFFPELAVSARLRASRTHSDTVHAARFVADLMRIFPGSRTQRESISSASHKGRGVKASLDSHVIVDPIDNTALKIDLPATLSDGEDGFSVNLESGFQIRMRHPNAARWGISAEQNLPAHQIYDQCKAAARFFLDGLTMHHMQVVDSPEAGGILFVLPEIPDASAAWKLLGSLKINPETLEFDPDYQPPKANVPSTRFSSDESYTGPLVASISYDAQMSTPLLRRKMSSYLKADDYTKILTALLSDAGCEGLTLESLPTIEMTIGQGILRNSLLTGNTKKKVDFFNAFIRKFPDFAVWLFDPQRKSEKIEVTRQ